MALKATCRPQGEATSLTSADRKYDEIRENDGKDTIEFRVFVRMVSEPGRRLAINEIARMKDKCRCSVVTQPSAASKREQVNKQETLKIVTA